VRCLDLREKRAGTWGVCSSVKQSEAVALYPGVLERYPANDRYLAFLQSSPGFPVRADVPHLRGEVPELNRLGEQWLCSGTRRPQQA
jgi:hypothetical protein